MAEVPWKVVILLGSEAGIFLGMGVFLFYSVKVAVVATREHRWHQLKDL